MAYLKCSTKLLRLFIFFNYTFHSVLAAPTSEHPTTTTTTMNPPLGPGPGSDAGSIPPMPPPHFKKVRVAHAVLASTAWLIFFPMGSILIRSLQTTHKTSAVRVHAAVQMCGLVVFAAAAGLGIWMAQRIGALHDYHPVLGMVLLGCVVLQPVTELLNARLYRRYPHVIYLAYVHIWFGRLLITIGIIEGGLGFVFAGSFPMASADPAPRIAYGVVAIIVWVLYVGLAIVWPETKHAFNSWKRR